MIKTFQHRQIISEGYFRSPQTHGGDITRDVTRGACGFCLSGCQCPMQFTQWTSHMFPNRNAVASLLCVVSYEAHTWMLPLPAFVIRGLAVSWVRLRGRNLSAPTITTTTHTPLPCIGLELFLAGQRKSAFQHE